jgi:hypothetical protein
MKFIHYSARTTDMIIKTYYKSNKIVYQLPLLEKVDKDTKMSLVFHNGYWCVVAQNAKSQVPWEKTRTELYT